MLSDVSDENNAYMVYFVSFLGTLAVLPGNIVSALLMDKIGRLRMLGNGGPGGCKEERWAPLVLVIRSSSCSKIKNNCVKYINILRLMMRTLLYK